MEAAMLAVVRASRPTFRCCCRSASAAAAARPPPPAAVLLRGQSKGSIGHASLSPKRQASLRAHKAATQRPTRPASPPAWCALALPPRARPVASLPPTSPATPIWLCRSPQDKLAWAVHAFLLAQGFKLVATGPAAEDESTGACTATSPSGRAAEGSGRRTCSQIAVPPRHCLLASALAGSHTSDSLPPPPLPLCQTFPLTATRWRLMAGTRCQGRTPSATWTQRVSWRLGRTAAALRPAAGRVSSFVRPAASRCGPSHPVLLCDAFPLTAGQRAPLYLKCLAVGDQLLLHWTAGTAGQNPGSGGGGGGGGASAPAAGEPGSLELDAAAYTTDAATAPACYKHMAQLLAKLRYGEQVAPGRLRGGAGGVQCGCAAAAAVGEAEVGEGGHALNFAGP